MNAYSIETNAIGDNEFIVMANDPTSACEIVSEFHKQRGWQDYPVIKIELIGSQWPSTNGVQLLLFREGVK